MYFVSLLLVFVDIVWTESGTESDLPGWKTKDRDFKDSVNDLNLITRYQPVRERFI